MFVVICYDIPDNRRRTRVHKALKSFGENVQKSVFEASLNRAQLEQMRQTVQPLLQAPDRLRCYTLCRECHGKITGTRSHPTAVVERCLVL